MFIALFRLNLSSKINIKTTFDVYLFRLITGPSFYINIIIKLKGEKKKLKFSLNLEV